MKKHSFTALGIILVAIFAVVFVIMPSLLKKDVDVVEESGADLSSKEEFTIGLLQLMSHPSLDEIREGIYDGLAKRGYVSGENLNVLYENGQGDANNLKMMSDYFVSEDVDLMAGIATPAAQAVANASNGEIPVVISAVTDPVGAGLVENPEKPGANITGTSDNIDVSLQLDLLLSVMPDLSHLGIMYNSSEVNVEKIVQKMEKDASGRGISVTVLTVTSTNDIAQVTEQLASDVEAVWLPNDNTMASSMETIIPVCDAKGVPVFPSVDAMVAAGGVATLGVNQYQIGLDTASVIADILEGADVSSYSVVNSVQNDVYYNSVQAEKLGITLPSKILSDGIDVSKEAEK